MKTIAPGRPAAPVVALRRERVVVGGLCALLIAGYGVAAPTGARSLIDHAAFLRTLSRMRRGASYYPAFRDSFRDVGVRLGSSRAYRTPTMFLFWRWIPPSLLFTAYLVLVVGGTAVLLLCMTRRPFVVLPVVFYLLYAGRRLGPAGGNVEAWMLVEMWTVPLIAGCLLACRHRRWAAAALLAMLAVLVREIALPLLAGGLLTAQVRRVPRWPWIAASGGALALFGLHTFWAAGLTVAHGNEASLRNTVGLPTSVFAMTSWALPGRSIAGVAVWVLALLHVRRLGQSALPGAFLLVIPAYGLFVSRPYWGLVAIPFAILWAGEELADLVNHRRRTYRAERRATDQSGDRAMRTT